MIAGDSVIGGKRRRRGRRKSPVVPVLNDDKRTNN